MMRKVQLSILVTLFSVAGTNAQTATWADDIAPILYAKCTSCHHVGGLAPNPLITYAQAFNYKTMIKQYVDTKKMPPWPPDADYKHLAFERLVTSAEKQKITDWVLGGGLQGNINNAPPAPSYTNNASQLSSIDFSAKMADYTVSTSQDLYRCFVIPTNFASDKFAAEVEVKPGNSSIVHHVLVFEDTSQIIVNKDNLDPGPGYTSFFGTGSGSSRLLGEWVPGTAPIKFPTNMGIRMKANTRLILQIHYPGGVFGVLDSTRVNIKYAPGTPREVFLAPILTESAVVNGPFSIPANTVKTFTQQYTNNYPLPFTLLSIAPHMHLIGKKYKVFAVGTVNDTIPLIYIPNWDFKWQGVYSFRNPIKMGPNYKVIGQTEYDNTSGNPSNPNTPPQTINQGEATTDEMMQTYFAFLLYQTGDENIVIDNSPLVGIEEKEKLNSIVKTVQLYQVFPNPASGKASLSYFSPEKLSASAAIYNMEGKLVKEWKTELHSGFGEMNLPVEGIGKGQYFVSIKAANYTKTRTFLLND